jgi:hypothetical protein
MQAAFYTAALRGDSSAAIVCLKINERRSAMLGFDMPTTIRTDPVLMAKEAHPHRETSTHQAAARRHSRRGAGWEGVPPVVAGPTVASRRRPRRKNQR